MISSYITILCLTLVFEPVTGRPLSSNSCSMSFHRPIFFSRSIGVTLLLAIDTFGSPSKVFDVVSFFAIFLGAGRLSMASRSCASVVMF